MKPNATFRIVWPLPVRDMSLSMWWVYDHPADVPEKYVARRFEVGKGLRPTDDVVVADDLDEIRRTLRGWGLTRLAREAEDDPDVVETWM